MFIYTIFKVRAIPSMGRCQCCHGNRWRCGRMDEAGLSLDQAGAKPHLWLWASHLRSWTVLLSLWEVGKGVAGLGGWMWRGFYKPLHNSPFSAPFEVFSAGDTRLSRDLLVMAADKCDCSCLWWLRPALLLPFCISTNVINAISVSSVWFTFPPPCMCDCAYTHMENTWKHLFSTFPELHCPFLQLEDVNKWLVCIWFDLNSVLSFLTASQILSYT